MITGDLSERPNLLFFDLTECVKPSPAALAGCPTPQETPAYILSV